MLWSFTQISSWLVPDAPCPCCCGERTEGGACTAAAEPAFEICSYQFHSTAPGLRSVRRIVSGRFGSAFAGIVAVPEAMLHPLCVPALRDAIGGQERPAAS